MYTHIAALREAIRCFQQSQAALARAIGVGRTTINNWLNGRARISYYYAVKIELVTAGQVAREKLAPGAQFVRNPHTPLPDYVKNEVEFSNNTSNSTMTVYQRFEQAKKFQETLGKRQGQRTDLLLCRHSDEVCGRSDVLIAKIHGFKSKDAYRRTQKVFTQGCDLLKEALAKNEVTLSAAALLATLSHDEQVIIIQQGKKAMVAAAKDIRNKKALTAGQECVI